MISLKVDQEIELKMLELADSIPLFEVINKNRRFLRQWLPWLDSTNSVADSLAFIKLMRQEFANGKGLVLAIIYQGQMVGMIGAHQLNLVMKHTSFGYWLAEDFNGKGIMIRSCRALLKYLFEELKLKRVEAFAATGNLPSQKVLTSLGMQKEGVARSREWLYDHYVDHVMFSILSEEWSELSK